MQTCLMGSYQELQYFYQNTSSTLLIQIYTNMTLKGMQPTMLNIQGSILTNELQIKQNGYLMLNSETLNNKIVHSECEKYQSILEGYLIIARIVLKIDHYEHITEFDLLPEIINPKIVEEQVYYTLNKPSKLPLVNSQFHTITNHTTQILLEGMIVKFGKQVYKLIDPKNITYVIADQIRYLQPKKGICKICLEQSIDYSSDNFLISPCLCTGSCGLVHILCLIQWIKIKVITSNSNKYIHSYNLTKIECEICKFKLPLYLNINNKQWNVLPKDVFSNYIVLYKIENNMEKSIMHCLSVGQTQAYTINIGRHSSNQLILNDMSVSRYHASMTLNSKKQLLLQDLGSKFGTFINFIQPYQDLSTATLVANKLIYKFKLNHNYLTL